MRTPDDASPPRGRTPFARARARLLGVVLTAATMVPGLHGAAMLAGAGQVDITPPPGLPMYGFLERIAKHQVSTGTLDPLFARVLVLQAGDRRLALVTLDLGRTFNDAWLGRLRRAARVESRVDALVVTASHTHAGPNILDTYPDGRLPAWQEGVLDKVSGAIREAAGRLEPVRLGVGYGDACVGYNRRDVGPDGRVTMIWSNPGKAPKGPVDTTVGVVRIDRDDGSPLAILVNYACHPVVLGADNLRYSADFVGPMASAVSGAFAGNPACLFLQGAAGDINPYYAATPQGQDAAGRCAWTGRELGAEAARVAKAIETRADAEPRLDFADDIVASPWRWDPATLRDGLLRADGPLALEDHAGLLAGAPPETLELHVTTVLINRRIALVGMPGEPFVGFQVAWRSRCPAPECLFLGYTNGYFDYFPTLLAAAQGGYGAADSNTYVAVGTGERMLDRAVVRVHEMLGELGDVPRFENGAPPRRP